MIKIKFRKKWKEVDIEGSVREVLIKAGINPETVVVSRNGEIIPDTTNVKSGETLETVRIISGG